MDKGRCEGVKVWTRGDVRVQRCGQGRCEGIKVWARGDVKA